LPDAFWEPRLSALRFRASLADERRGEFGRRPAEQAATGLVFKPHRISTGLSPHARLRRFARRDALGSSPI
jgi:hypothetical protein